MTQGETFEEVVSRRIARRDFLKGGLAAVPLLVLSRFLTVEGLAFDDARDNLTFKPISLDNQDRTRVPDGYVSLVVIRWGDPLHPDSPRFDPARQTPEAQNRQFGYNNDFVGLMPLPLTAPEPNRGLLVVNHEYTNPELMFPRYLRGEPTRTQVDIEIAAHGISVVELKRDSNRDWGIDVPSKLNRRITGETLFSVTGPAAGHDWMKVSYDRGGNSVRGTLNNCSGGLTPWGTYLSGEENFNFYFANSSALADGDKRKAIHARYGISSGSSGRRWEHFHSRFDVGKEPNEPFRFGWVVEVDPYDPDSTPLKRTALGRFKHEAATTVIAPDGRAVVYSGDDERFEHIYKFVSSSRFNPANRDDNRRLLEDGVLYAAKFKDDGTGEWLPLVAGRGALSSWSQAEVLINAREAARLLGATMMDRPEDIETNPANGRVYCVMTNNLFRGVDGNPAPDPANPRSRNRHGHIIELSEDRGDAASVTFKWEMFMVCGDPSNKDDQTFFAGFDRSGISPISCPDNIEFDKSGNLWIATDGQPLTLKNNDGIYAVPVAGPTRGYVRQFMSGVVGCETAGLFISRDDETLFVSIQHPGEGSRFETPSSTFPDGSVPPRPSIVAVRRALTPGRIGS